MIAATVTGYASVFKRIANYSKSMGANNMSKRALNAAEYAKTAAWVEMLETPPGKMWSGNVRPSSRPGKYPAVQTAALARSMKAYVAGRGVAYWDAGGGGVPQAFYMEFGRSGAAPRPYMRTTTRKYRKEIMERLGARTGSTDLLGVPVRMF